MSTAAFEARDTRVKTALNLGQPDRVPFIPSIQNFYTMGYDYTVYDGMKSLPAVTPALDKYLAAYDPDLFLVPQLFPIDVMEEAQAQNLRWPGAYWNLPLDTPYQYIDESFLGDDDWDAFLADPTRFLLSKVLPARYKAFEGLSLLNVQGLCGQAPLSLAGAGIPPVAQALRKLADVGELTMRCAGEVGQMCQYSVQKGYPFWGDFVTMSPFDEFADCIRGFLPTLMDLQEDPEMVNAAVTRWGEVSIPAAVARGKMTHAQYAMIPLHCGMDSMMSVETYEKYYWPHLKKLLLALVDAGITPIALCEGGYNTRLDIISDIPAGKVIYFFEEVDMAQAKKKLAKVACVAGNFDTSLLNYGTKEEVVAETKRLIDACAPGGGYIMTNSMALDNARHDLLEAWYETTLTYGKY